VVSPISTAALTATLLVASYGTACRSPARAIKPVVYARDDQAAIAMRSAPVILAIKITAKKLTGDVKMVERPQAVGGPILTRIPLHLARIQADTLIALRGHAAGKVEFYSWMWASGTHGGARLFHPEPGACRIVFLRDEDRFLHTVGDYPSHDLELPSTWSSAFIAAWKSGSNYGSDLFERMVALRLRAELDGISITKIREIRGYGPRRPYHLGDLGELVRLVGPLFVVTQLDDICRNSANPSARVAACQETYESFAGRCRALEFAHAAELDATGSYSGPKLPPGYCKALNSGFIRDIRQGTEHNGGFLGSNLSPQHRRETMRVYASAMDADVHAAACEAAARLPDCQDLPECSRAHAH
jgi:hypothetical protein